MALVTAPLAVVLAGPRADDSVAAILTAMREGGVAVQYVELDPARADDHALEATYRAFFSERIVSEGIASEGIASELGPRAIIGGFSIGGRLAARVAPTLAAHGLLCFAYPFHRRGAPADRHGLAALSAVATPTCIVQGTRDSHGTESEVRGYGLPDHVEMVWLRDGNHRFEPRARSGLTASDHLASAAAAALAFCRAR